MSRGLPKNVKKSLEKALDSTLLAIEMYNKPAVKFKSGGYIVMMVIGWTALFHAIFFKKNIKPFYKTKGKFDRKDGDYSYWELKTCVAQYFGADQNNPIRKNLEFFIPLRNMIEHKSIPEIDADIFAECQAMLLNFDRIVEKEFDSKYCLRECLSFALQLYPSSRSLNNAIVDNPSNKPIIDFIKIYRSAITADILETGEYSFKAFLIQVANHDSKTAVPIQFVAYDKLDAVQKTNVNRITTLVKNKFVQVPVTNAGLLKPSIVVNKVQKALGDLKVNKNGRDRDKFNQDAHTRCWKKYAVRPENGAENPEHTTAKYCVYDQPNGTYLYTEEWSDFLIEELATEENFDTLYN